MKAIILLFALSSFLSYQLDYQAITKPTSTEISDSTTVYIYTWGINESPVSQTKCAVKLQKKYGFGYQSQGSCMMDDLDRMRRFNRHNREVRAILEERHGTDWEERFDAELENCEAQ
ncbi:MAG: hypothetical protein ACI85O_000751 [Saprospiraceae bacterium]|jgi:hypothetical protein